MVPPAQPSPTSGPWLTLARVGFRPTSPHSLAGIRIDPPPSLAWATGTIPLATAAAEPPDDPPVEWPVFHGLRAGGNDFGSGGTVVPEPRAVGRPRGTNPAPGDSPGREDGPGHRRGL